MSRRITIHPVSPQQRLLDQAVAALRAGELVVYPTDSGYALGAMIGNPHARDRIKTIRHLGERHHYTLVCRDFAQLGRYVLLTNSVFRAVKSSTPGPYTFILPAAPELRGKFLHPKKHTVGARIPEHPVVRELLATLGEPILSSTLILPGETEPMTDGWAVKEALDHVVDAVLDSGECGSVPTTVVDFTGDEGPVIARHGAGDASRFEE